jgi:hypothetical protein
MNALTALQLYIIAVELFFLGLEAVTQHPDWFEAPQTATIQRPLGSQELCCYSLQ